VQTFHREIYYRKRGKIIEADNSRGQLVAPVADRRGFRHSRDTEIRSLISRWIELSEAPAYIRTG